MKKLAMNSKQAGFTLIELIVVIVILGILAATALPKFADLGADARIATLRAAGGSMESASAMIHGKYLLTSPAPTSITVEGTAVNITNGYPSADLTLAAAAGLKTGAGGDWVLVANSAAATANTPATAATEIAIIPSSVAGSTKGLTCYIKYTAATATVAAFASPPVTTGC